MQSSKYPYLYLTEIHDAHSSWKSLRAIDIIQEILSGRYDVKYISNPNQNETYACTNPYTGDLIDGYLKEHVSECGQCIKDVFVVEDRRPSNKKTKIHWVGNHCVSGLFPDQLEDINRLLKIKNVCELCGGNTTKMHKACILGTGKREGFLDKKEQTLLKQQVHTVIKFQVQYRTLRWLLSKTPFFKKPFRGDSIRNQLTMAKYMGWYEHIYPYINDLKKFKNNPLINNIRNNTRYPSAKQIALLEKIIQDRDRMLKIDALNKPPLNYLKYGYVYPSRY